MKINIKNIFVLAVMVVFALELDIPQAADASTSEPTVNYERAELALSANGDGQENLEYYDTYELVVNYQIDTFFTIVKVSSAMWVFIVFLSMIINSQYAT